MLLVSVLPLIILCSQLKWAHPKIRMFNPVTLSNLCYRDKIIPDVIGFAPVNVLKVQWENISADLGDPLSAHDVQSKPTFHWPNDDEIYYTLIYTAPDMPDPKNSTQREYQHWIVVNVPGIYVEQGETLTDYIPPVTPSAPGPQRYVFLVYIQQTGNMTFSEPYIPPKPNEIVRGKFVTQNFVKKYDLGVPFAANWFIINWKEPLKHSF